MNSNIFLLDSNHAHAWPILQYGGSSDCGVWMNPLINIVPDLEVQPKCIQGEGLEFFVGVPSAMIGSGGYQPIPTSFNHHLTSLDVDLQSTVGSLYTMEELWIGAQF